MVARPPLTLGALLAGHRLQAGFSQEALAKQAGLSDRSVAWSCLPAAPRARR
jgi:hypothetical protein